MSKELRERAEAIMAETREGENTPERVGGVMVDTIVEMDAVKAKLDEFMGFTYVSRIEIPTEGGGVVLGVKTTCENWGIE